MLNMETSKRSGMKAGDPKRFGSFFSISGPWVRENFERHSRLMLAGIIGFAVAVLLPLIITIRTNGGAKEGADAIAGFFRGNMTGNIANNIEDYQTGDIAYHATIVFGYLFAKIFSALLYIISTVLCIAAATAVFDYLHDPAAALSTHSMPLRRGTLFRSSWLSGFIMLAIPLIIVGAVTGIILMKTGYSHTAGDLTVWIIKILICLLFIYSMSSLAAVLSGNTVTTIIAALFLNFGILAIAMIINYCMSAFLTGIDLK